MQGESYSSEKA